MTAPLPALPPVEVELPYELLARSLAGARAVTDPKADQPFAKLVLLTVGDGGGVRFDASSVALGWRSEEEGQRAKPGAVAVNCHDFAARVASLPKGAPVRLKIDGSTLKASAVGKARSFSLGVVPAEEVPKAQGAEDSAVAFDVNGELLSALLGAVFHARSTDQTRETMAGVQLAGENGKIIARATDGHRVARVESALAEVPTFAALLPERGVVALRHLCSQWTTIRLTIGERRVFAAGGAGTRLCINLPQAAFPQMDRHLKAWKKDAPNLARVHKETLLESLKALRPSATQIGGFDLIFRPDGMLELFGPGHEGVGEGRDEVSYDAKTPIDARTRLNVAYLIDSLTSLTCDEVNVGVGGSLDPLSIAPIDGPRPETFLIVMPMKS